VGIDYQHLGDLLSRRGITLAVKNDEEPIEHRSVNTRRQSNGRPEHFTAESAEPAEPFNVLRAFPDSAVKSSWTRNMRREFLCLRVNVVHGYFVSFRLRLRLRRTAVAFAKAGRDNRVGLRWL
jgi:hypothetical protein